MPDALLILPPAILAVVVIASGIAKLRHPDDLAGWRELGVPKALQRGWLVRLHPWAEIALGIALLALGGVLGLLAGIAAVLLMAAYLWLIVRAWRREEDASCACFGATTPVTGVTVARNVWLLALAAVSLIGLWSAPLLGGVVALAAESTVWMWLAGAAVTAVTAVLVTWREPARASTSGAASIAPDDSGEGEVEELDYLRVRTPAVPVTLADGTVVNLRTLTSRRPIMMFAVTSTCGACTPVIDKVPEWRTVLPEVELRLLLMQSPEQSSLTEVAEPQSVHDPEAYLRDSIGWSATPTAVLFGIDGMLAGGPVTGFDEIEQFISEVRASLDEVVEATAEQTNAPDPASVT